MSSSSEKMAILNMLEQGKITADNAAKLLAAIDSQPENKDGRDYGAQQKSQDQGADVKKWALNLGRKIETVAKDLEPKIQKLAGTVAQKSIEIADATAKTIQSHREAAAERNTPGSAPYGMSAAKGGNEASFELLVTDDYSNELTLRSPKGHVNIKGYNGDKATINLSYKSRLSGGGIDFLKSGGVYQLNYDPEEFEFVNIDAYVPSAMFRHIRAESAEGMVSIENITSPEITVNTTKCHVSAKNIVSDIFKIDNLDGPVLLSNISGGRITAETSNAGIDAANTDCRILKYETTGEGVSIISQGFYRYNDYDWTVRTSNARLKAILPVSPDTGYDIKAYTSLSDVSNGLPDISYIRNDRNHIEGKTSNYGGAAKKVKIELATSNAPLHIN